jgi:dethiobiotin synthetase
MSRSIFITATDTSAGKTWVTTALVSQALALNLDIQAIKPIASGVNRHGINDDVSTLASAQDVSPESINYITYQAAKAPALAANLAHKPLPKEDFLAWVNKQRKQKDITLIEGVGGLMVPLYADAQDVWLVSDWLAAMADIEVMLVVPLQLGCINHVLLSFQHLKQLGKIPKWIVLNDLHNNKTLAETQSLVCATLKSKWGETPEILGVSYGGDIANIW